jgi:site-specific DNA-methyltransferase (adenine-specific)
MTLYYNHAGITIYHGDNMDVMSGLESESVDSIVTDPPYGLTSERPSGRSEATKGRVMKGFMGLAWDGSIPSVETFAEMLRILKPGGHMLCFGGTRTFHRIWVNIEDAGFEIRDCLAWMYGSGFPKSHDVSKAIDKAGGISPQKQAIALKNYCEEKEISRRQLADIVGCTESSIRDWENGRARAKGKDVEYIVPSSRYREKLASLLDYTKDERVKIGETIDRRGDGSVVGLGHSGLLRSGGHTEAAKQWDGWGTALKPAFEPICLARKPFKGSIADNVLKHGTGAINISESRIGTEERVYDLKGGENLNQISRVGKGDSPDAKGCGAYGIGAKQKSIGQKAVNGRFPSNVLLDDQAAEILDEQSGELTSGANPTRRSSDKFRNTYRTYEGQKDCSAARGADTGGASRFFWVAQEDEDSKGREGEASADRRYTERGSTNFAAKPGPRGGDSSGRWPANIILDDEAAAILDKQSGTLTSSRLDRSKITAQNKTYGKKPKNMHGIHSADEGFASRFFYVAKASKEDRGKGNDHPTVKPIKLMKYLCKLITPLGGMILEPFMGSGSTLIAAHELNFKAIGIELNEKDCATAVKRLRRQGPRVLTTGRESVQRM